MDWISFLWKVNGVIWGLLIVGFIGLVIFNRARNRKRKDDDNE